MAHRAAQFDCSRIRYNKALLVYGVWRPILVEVILLPLVMQVEGVMYGSTGMPTSPGTTGYIMLDLARFVCFCRMWRPQPRFDIIHFHEYCCHSLDHLNLMIVWFGKWCRGVMAYSLISCQQSNCKVTAMLNFFEMLHMHLMLFAIVNLRKDTKNL